ncbi:MAG TPA: MFS transporter [Methylomirabilota bacterium]|nr:MFS transporter [Methylomirabilota bacterium]
MSKTFAPVASLFLGLAFLLCGNGLQTTLTPLRADLEGFSAIQIGLMGSGYYAGFVLGCLVAPYLIAKSGHIRTFAALVSAASAVALIHPIAIEPVTWVVARAVTGFSLAGLYLIIESWLNDRATNENRGFVMSAYIIVSFVTITIGQLLVTTASIEDFRLFAVASILVSVATIPVVLTSTQQPTPVAIVQFRPIQLFKVAPVGLMGSFMIGVANGAFWSLGTLYGTSRGLSANGAAVFMSIAVFGGAVMQWPIGRLSDRLDRRLVLAGVMMSATVVGLLLALLPLGMTGIYIMAALFGMTTLTSYSVAAAHAYDRADPSAYVEMAAGILLANGLGSVIGPFSAAALMGAFGANFLFVFTAGVQLAMLAFIAARTVVRAPTLKAEKETFDVYSAVAVGPVLSRETFEEEPPAEAEPEPEADANVTGDDPSRADVGG